MLAIVEDGQRPVLLVAPLVVAHHEDPHRRVRVGAVVDPLQVTVEPADMDRGRVGDDVVGQEAVAAAREDAVVVAVRPRADDQPRSPRRLGRAVRFMPT